MNKDKILDKIEKKIDQIEKLHDKESLLCEEVKDLISEIREEDIEENDDIEEEDFDDEDIDDEETWYLFVIIVPNFLSSSSSMPSLI